MPSYCPKDNRQPQRKNTAHGAALGWHGVCRTAAVDCHLMQRLRDIRALLSAAGLKPRHRLGQNFLIDANLMNKLLATAEIDPDVPVLEVGPGTGSMTEMLLERARRVVAVEVDAHLAELLAERLGSRGGFQLLRCDILAGKHEIAPQVLAALGGRAQLVANLPYNVATPLLAECLIQSWRAHRGDTGACLFEAMTVTIQREVADRLCAKPGGRDYGPVSVLASLLGKITPGAILPPAAFWPAPKVHSQMVRIVFDAEAAGKVASIDVLKTVLSVCFAQRRKQIHSAGRRRGVPVGPEAFAKALAQAGIDPTLRPEHVGSDGFCALANALQAILP